MPVAATTAPSAQRRRRGQLARRFIDVVEPMLEVERYADLSVERLITAVGISRSTFYVYFQDKGDLLSAMAEGVVGDLFASGGGWWDLGAEGTWDDLRAALLPPTEVYRRNRAILGSVIETASYDVRVRQQHTLLINGVVAALSEHIRASQAAGVGAPDLDPDRTAAWLVWMFERGLHQFLGDASAAEADEQLDALTTVVWRTLYEGYRK